MTHEEEIASYDEALARMHAELDAYKAEREAMKADALRVKELLEEVPKALKVLTQTPHIRAYLAVMDPKALEQAETALGVPEFLRGALNGPLADLRDMQVLLEGVRCFVREYEAAEEVRSMAEIRRGKRAIELGSRLALGMAALAEREEKVNAEEAAKEARKAAMMGDEVS